MAAGVYARVSPGVVGLPGGLAGAAGAALGVEGVRVSVRILGREGIRVEVVDGGVGGAAARAAEAVAGLLLEMLGEEAWLRLEASPGPGSVAPVAEAAGAAAAAVAGLLGVEPEPGDLASALARATGLAAGAPLLPLAAAAYLGASAVASEQPPVLAPLRGAGGLGVLGVVVPCRRPGWPPVAVTGDRARQLLQAAAVAAALLASGEAAAAKRLLAVESPWDYAAPQPLRSARAAALQEGAEAAGVDPYTGALVVLGPEAAVAAAAARLGAGLGCEPRVLRARVLGAPAEEGG